MRCLAKLHANCSAISSYEQRQLACRERFRQGYTSIVAPTMTIIKVPFGYPDPWWCQWPNNPTAHTQAKGTRIEYPHKEALQASAPSVSLRPRRRSKFYSPLHRVEQAVDLTSALSWLIGVVRPSTPALFPIVSAHKVFAGLVELTIFINLKRA